MSSEFIKNHALRDAFAANLLDSLVGLIVEQGEALLQDADLHFQSRAVSTLLLLGERGPMAGADIAQVLGQPHQLVAQRVDLLINLDLIQKYEDPQDKRRKVLALTPEGLTQFQRLQDRLQQARDAFRELFVEIDCDLSQIATRAIEAIAKRPLLDRINDLPHKIHPPKG